jgi:hypothetical protein
MEACTHPARPAARSGDRAYHRNLLPLDERTADHAPLHRSHGARLLDEMGGDQWGVPESKRLAQPDESLVAEAQGFLGH